MEAAFAWATGSNGSLSGNDAGNARVDHIMDFLGVTNISDFSTIKVRDLNDHIKNSNAALRANQRSRMLRAIHVAAFQTVLFQLQWNKVTGTNPVPGDWTQDDLDKAQIMMEKCGWGSKPPKPTEIELPTFDPKASFETYQDKTRDSRSTHRATGLRAWNTSYGT